MRMVKNEVELGVALNVGREIALLKQMTVRELREKYLEVFGEPTRAGNKDFLFKRIAWRIQALAEGDLSERARQRAAELARDGDLRTTAPRLPATATTGNLDTDTRSSPAVSDQRIPLPGTVLTRVYRGQAHHVVVRDDGFEYDGRVFRSLSAIAKMITGSHWNGLLFFKLAKSKRGGSASKGTPNRKREIADG